MVNTLIPPTRTNLDANASDENEQDVLPDQLKAGNFDFALDSIPHDKLACYPFGPKQYTVLHYACQHGRIDIVEKVLAACSLESIRETLSHHPTPCDVAEENGHEEIKQRLSAMLLLEENSLPVTAHLEPSNVESDVPVLPEQRITESDSESDIVQMCTSNDVNALRLLATKSNFDFNSFADGSRTPLHIASQRGSTQVARALALDFNCNYNVRDSVDGMTPLHLACTEGHLGVVEVLCDLTNINLNARDKQKRTPLHCASLEGHIEIVKFLATVKRCRATLCDANGDTPAQLAAKAGHTEIDAFLSSNAQQVQAMPDKINTDLKELVSLKMIDYQHSSNESTNRKQGFSVLTSTPLHLAVVRGNLEKVRASLQDEHCSINSLDGEGHTPVITAAYLGHTDIVKLLSSHSKCDLSKTDKDKRTALHYASEEGFEDIVKVLSNRKKDITMLEDKNGIIALHLAAFNGHLAIVNILLALKSSDQQQANQQGRNALHLACHQGYLHVVRYLVIERHFDPMSKDFKGVTPLHFAAFSGCRKVFLPDSVSSPGTTPHSPLKLVQFLTQHGSSCLSTDNNNSTPLHYAAYAGHCDVVEYLAQHPSINPHHEDNMGRTAVHHASQEGHLPVLQFLLDKCGCDGSLPDTARGLLPMHLAALNGHIQVVKYLYSLDKFSVNCCDRRGRKPLYYATKRSHLEVSQFLKKVTHITIKDSKADNAQRNKGNPELSKLNASDRSKAMSWFKENATNTNYIAARAFAIKGNLHQLQQLVSANGNEILSGLGPLGETILNTASFAGNFEVVKYLVNQIPSSVDSVDEGNRTPLHNAAHEGHLNIVKYLITEGHANVNPCDSNLRTPLHYACQNGHLSTLAFLVKECNSPINDRDEKGITPFLLAAFAFFGRLNVVRFLVNENYNINSKDNNDQRPLHCAAQEGKFPVVEFLVSCKECETEVIDKHGRTPLHYACQNGHLSTASLFIQNNLCSCELQDSQGSTPLHLAAYNDHLDVVKLICSKSTSSIHIEDGVGKTPLHVACQEGSAHVVKYLVLEQHCNPFKRDKIGVSPLDLAIAKDCPEIVTFIKENANHEVPSPACDFMQHRRLKLGFAACEENLDELKRMVSEYGTGIVEEKGLQGETVLHNAASGGHLNIVRYLVVECKSRINSRDEEGHTPLHNAAHEGKVEVVQFLASHPSCDLQVRDKHGRIPLHYACQNGHFDAARVLLKDYKCNSLVQDSTNGSTSLHLAAGRNHLQILKMICSMPNCKPDLKDKHGRTALHYACQENSIATAKYLISEQKCDPYCQDSKGITPYLLAVGNSDIIGYINEHAGEPPNQSSASIVQMLAARGNLEQLKKLHAQQGPHIMNEKDSVDQIALHTAAGYGHVNVVRYLVQECNSEVNSQDKDGHTPLHNAARGGNYTIVDYLIKECGSDINAKDKDGHTPLHLAAHDGHLETAKVILSQADCIVNLPDNNQQTPLHYAAQNGHLNVVEHLIEVHACDPMITDEKGISPFHLAAGNGKLSIVRFMLSKGNCNPQQLDVNGCSSLHLVSQEGHLDVAKLLVTQCKCSCMLRDKQNGVTALHLAAINGHVQLLSFFSSLEECIMDTQDDHGRTPLRYACQQNHLDVVKLLVEECHCDPFKTDKMGGSPLLLATLNGCQRIVQYLSSSVSEL